MTGGGNGGRPPAHGDSRSPYVWTPWRHRLLEQCERAIWWALWGADGSGPKARRARALRRRRTVSRTVDEALGYTISRLLRVAGDRGDRPDLETLLHEVEATLRLEWRYLRQDLWDRWVGAAPSACLSPVVSLRAPWRLPDGLIERERARARTCLAHVVDASLLDDLAAAGPAESYLGSRAGGAFVVHAAGSGSTAHVTAMAVVDAAYRHYDLAACAPLIDRATWCLVDVAIGKPEDDEIERLRLVVAALWLESVGHEPTAGAYLARVVDLQRGVDRWSLIDVAARERARRRILQDQQRLIAKLARTSARRQPREEWRMTGAPHACPACQYREVCRADVRRMSPTTSPTTDEPGGDS